MFGFILLQDKFCFQTKEARKKKHLSRSYGGRLRLQGHIGAGRKKRAIVLIAAKRKEKEKEKGGK